MMKLQLIFAINLLLYCVYCDDNDERMLSMTVNPGCEEQLDPTQCDGITFVHVEASSATNTIHYLWDFTGVPSFLLAKTDKNVSLAMDWNAFMGGKVNSLQFSSTPEYIFSAVMHQILLFDDVSDKGNVNDASVKDITSIDPHTFNWTRASDNKWDNKIEFVMNATVETNGTFAVRLSAYGSTKHGDELPHLFHSAHSMQVDLIADKINYMNYSSPRIAIEFLLVTSENKTEGGFMLNKRRNLDDEFTPGIFDVFNIVSPRSNNDSRGAYLQYRPICYTTKWRTVSDSTELEQGNILSFNDNEQELKKFIYTLPYSYYGYGLSSRIAQGTNITFGMPNDGFFSKSNYTSFSMLLGIGAAPVERLSAFVVTFAAIGLGVPLLVLLVGGSYVAIKRYRN